MSEVFISYSSQDKIIADAVCHYLEARSIECWIAPRNESPGRLFAEVIGEAITDCRVVVVIVSPTSMQSQHVLGEITMAVDRGRAVVPFRIADIRPERGFELYLSSRHWIDAFPDTEEYFEDLALSIRGFLDVACVSPDSLKANRNRHLQRRNLEDLKRANDETRVSLVASLMNRSDVMDQDHRYLRLKRIDVLDSDSGNYRSYRWLTVRNASSAQTTFLVHQESGENKVPFRKMGVVARSCAGDSSNLAVSSITPIQPNFCQAFKIYFDEPLEPGATMEVFYKLDWPGELESYVEGQASQSVSLTRYERGIDYLEFSIFDIRRIVDHSLSEVTAMYEEIRSPIRGESMRIDDEPDLAPLHGRALYGVRYKIPEPTSICYRIAYGGAPDPTSEADDDVY